MLSLFFGVGRYRYSTLQVVQYLGGGFGWLSALFSAQRYEEMRRRNCKVVKYNEGLSDAIFELVFETLWVAPYDRRRLNAAWCEYDRCARRAVTLLSVTDLDAPLGETAANLSRTMEMFLLSVLRIDQDGLFPDQTSRKAVAQARAVCEEVWRRCPALRPKEREQKESAEPVV